MPEHACNLASGAVGTRVFGQGSNGQDVNPSPDIPRHPALDRQRQSALLGLSLAAAPWWLAKLPWCSSFADHAAVTASLIGSVTGGAVAALATVIASAAGAPAPALATDTAGAPALVRLSQASLSMLQRHVHEHLIT